jgi:hypothetical protein
VLEARYARGLKTFRCSAGLKGAYEIHRPTGCWAWLLRLFQDSPSKPLRSAEAQGAREARFKD